MNINNTSAVSFNGVYAFLNGTTKEQECLMDNITKKIDYTEVFNNLPKKLDVILSRGPKCGAKAKFLYGDEFVKNANGEDLSVNLATDSESNINKLLGTMQNIIDGKFEMPKFDAEKFYAGTTDFFKMFPKFFQDCKQEAEETEMDLSFIVDLSRDDVWH